MIYFAYGSNLSREQMACRCSKSTPLKPVVLHGYELTFVGFQSRWKGGVATIVPRQNGLTYGALYDMTIEDVEKLDQCEFIGAGIYRKIDLVLNRISAYTYVCNMEDYHLPSRKYLDTIKKGFEDWSLPLDTLSAIGTCD